VKRIIILVLIVLVAVLTGCIPPNPRYGVLVTDFDKVEIRNGFHVDVSVGEEYNVVLEVAENALQDVEAVKEGDTLIIRIKPGYDIRKTSLRAEVAMPVLTGLTLQNGSHVSVSGSGDDVTFNISGGSHATLANFAVENADLTASGGSHVTLNVSGRLDAEVNGGSHVTYRGQPSLGNIDISEGSSFRGR
jgi:hypothetical protein